MGGLCSRSSSVNNAPGGSFAHVNGHLNNSNGSEVNFQSSGEGGGEKDVADPSPVRENVDNNNKHTSESLSFPIVSGGSHPQNIEDGIPRLSRVLSQKSRSTKSRQAAVAKVKKLLSNCGV